MAVKSGFFNSVNGDRVYDASTFADYFATFIGNGVFPNPSTGLKVVEGDGLTTVVKIGKGWIDGYYVTNDADWIIAHDMPDGLLKRIDRIVLQKSTADRTISIVLKKGTYSNNPVAPSIVRNADFYELALADVYINAGTTQISQAHISDLRLNNELCGIVHGVVNQVDTTSIFNQYQSWFDNYSVTKANEFLTWQTNITRALEDWIDAQRGDFLDWRQAEETLYYAWLNGRKNEFDAWYATIRNILDENAAGNLQLQIDDHKNARLPHFQVDAITGQKYATGWIVEDGKLYFEYKEVTE